MPFCLRLIAKQGQRVSTRGQGGSHRQEQMMIFGRAGAQANELAAKRPKGKLRSQ